MWRYTVPKQKIIPQRDRKFMWGFKNLIDWMKNLTKWQTSNFHLQMAWRGYLGRIEYHRQLAAKVEQRQLNYFHNMATSKFHIQMFCDQFYLLPRLLFMLHHLYFLIHMIVPSSWYFTFSISLLLISQSKCQTIAVTRVKNLFYF